LINCAPRKALHNIGKLLIYKGEFKMADLNKLVEEISALSLMEAAELVKLLESKLGVTAAAPVAMAAMPVAAAAVAAPVEEKTEFDVVLKEAGAKKIEVIKVVRQLTTLGLKEAKDLVDGAPNKVLQAVGKDVANDAKSKLEAVGAVVAVE
jgi:large subunit ribosomal protein L7/L12